MGVVSGLVAGAVVASVASPGAVTGGAIMSATGHDIITCRAGYSRQDAEMCAYGAEYIAPEQYAGNVGYKILYKRGVLFLDKDKYIVMEVGK